MYYHHKLKEYSDNQKKTKVLRTLLPNKSSFNNPTSITVNNTTITDPRAIVEHLANSVDKVNHDNFCTYFKNACPSSIYLFYSLHSTRNLHAH